MAVGRVSAYGSISSGVVVPGAHRHIYDRMRNHILAFCGVIYLTCPHFGPGVPKKTGQMPNMGKAELYKYNLKQSWKTWQQEQALQ